MGFDVIFDVIRSSLKPVSHARFHESIISSQRHHDVNL